MTQTTIELKDCSFQTNANISDKAVDVAGTLASAIEMNSKAIFSLAETLKPSGVIHSAVDISPPPDFEEMGKVLKKVFAGMEEKNPKKTTNRKKKK